MHSCYYNNEVAIYNAGVGSPLTLILIAVIIPLLLLLTVTIALLVTIKIKHQCGKFMRNDHYNSNHRVRTVL